MIIEQELNKQHEINKLMIPFNFQHTDQYQEKIYEKLLNIITPLNGWICGGLPSSLFQRYIFHNTKFQNNWNDVDIFCKDQDAYDQITIEILNHFQHYSVEDKEWCKQIDTSALKKIQIIKPKETRTLQDILESFDLSCSQFALTKLHEITSLKQPNRSIEISKITDPYHTLYRIIKYSRRGWFINPAELIKVLVFYRETPEEYKKELDLELLNYETAPLKERFERMMRGYTF